MIKGKQQAIEELIFENTKGIILSQVQLSFMEEQLKNTTSSDLINSINRAISGRMSDIEQYLEHQKILKRLLEEFGK